MNENYGLKMRCQVSLKGHKPLDLQDCKKKKKTLSFPKMQLERKWFFLKIQTLKVWKTQFQMFRVTTF